MNKLVAQETLSDIDQYLDTLQSKASSWTSVSVEERILLLERIKDNTMTVAQAWVDDAVKNKQIKIGSELSGEEWLSGPYAILTACNLLITTLSQLDDKSFLNSLRIRKTHNGKLAVKVLPHNLWESLLLNGVKSEIWLQGMVTTENLPDYTATSYNKPETDNSGAVSVVLGAGNIASIAPLDCFQKLFVENSVVLLKMNPINDYLAEHLNVALAPLVDLGVLKIMSGDGKVGAALCTHPKVNEIHITGAKATHDLIVWGNDPEEAARLKQENTPINTKKVTSELGGVGPTIVTPGVWTSADIKYQAEQIATQKLHNNGFNCVASQMLVISSQWEQREHFLAELRNALSQAEERGLYYPRSDQNIDKLSKQFGSVETLSADTSGNASCLLIRPETEDEFEYAQNTEVFAPALFIKEIDEIEPLAFLQRSIEYSNNELVGSLGANIIIDPQNRRRIASKWDELIDSLHYGSIAINAWTGLAFLSPQSSWGAFPGETLNNVQSGIGVVHNTFMFSNVERTVVEAPFRPFPRNLMHGSFSLLPRPPWFISNKAAGKIGELLTRFQYKPSLLKIPAIFFHALRG